MKYLKMFEGVSLLREVDVVEFDSNYRDRNPEGISLMEINKILSLLKHWHLKSMMSNFEYRLMGTWMAGDKNALEFNLIKDGTISFYKFTDEWWLISIYGVNHNYWHFIADTFEGIEEFFKIKELPK